MDAVKYIDFPEYPLFTSSMLSAKAIALEHGLAAFEAAEVPPLPNGGTGLVSILSRDGMGDPYLPASLFMPHQYSITAAEQLELATLRWQVRRPWEEAPRAIVLMKRNLGPSGSRAVRSILPELAVMSASHGARSAVSVVRVAPRGNEPVTWVAMWDNGTTYQSPDDVRATFKDDGTPAKEVETRRASPGHVTREVLGDFGGKLSVWSAATGVDLSGRPEDPDVEVYETAGIVGTLVITTLPHAASRA